MIGITPADAGKTNIFCLIVFTTEDHPRGCGENVARCNDSNLNVGSPPRMRGKQTQTAPCRCTLRDHPRGCGENSMADTCLPFLIGSPPQVRGKPCGDRIINYNFRITPADAGKTLFCPPSSTAGKDHPRGCGENRENCRCCHNADGSPPRMRGKPRWSSGVDAARRITPADAGKTL